MRELEQQVKDFKDCKMSSQIAPHELEVLRKEKERQAKEIVLLRRTVEEMELRIETQKQTLGARDESIKKLLEMLQSKGLAVKQLEEDRLETERLNAKIMETDRRIKQLEKLLEQKDRDNQKLKEVSCFFYLHFNMFPRKEKRKKMSSCACDARYAYMYVHCSDSPGVFTST